MVLKRLLRYVTRRASKTVPKESLHNATNKTAPDTEVQSQQAKPNCNKIIFISKFLQYSPQAAVSVNLVHTFNSIKLIYSYQTGICETRRANVEHLVRQFQRIARDQNADVSELILAIAKFCRRTLINLFERLMDRFEKDATTNLMGIRDDDGVKAWAIRLGLNVSSEFESATLVGLCDRYAEQVRKLVSQSVSMRNASTTFDQVREQRTLMTQCMNMAYQLCCQPLTKKVFEEELYKSLKDIAKWTYGASYLVRLYREVLQKAPNTTIIAINADNSRDEVVLDCTRQGGSPSLASSQY